MITQWITSKTLLLDLNRNSSAWLKPKKTLVGFELLQEHPKQVKVGSIPGYRAFRGYYCPLKKRNRFGDTSSRCQNFSLSCYFLWFSLMDFFYYLQPSSAF